MKITSQTTLGDLEILKLKHGVTNLYETPRGPGMPYRVVFMTPDATCYGRGLSFAEACDDGFRQLIALEGERCAAKPPGYYPTT